MSSRSSAEFRISTSAWSDSSCAGAIAVFVSSPQAERNTAEPPTTLTPDIAKKRRRDSGSRRKLSTSIRTASGFRASDDQNRLRAIAPAGSPPDGGVHVRDLVDRQCVEPG